MGRTIVAEESVQTTVSNLAREQSWCVGLVVGQHSSQKDLVCHLASTPKDKESLEKDRTPKKNEKKGSKKMESLEELEDAWVAQHAKQVMRMLPGGVGVLGLFVVYPGESLPSSALTKLKQVLLAVFKVVSKQIQLSQDVSITDKMVLHICTGSEKVTAKTFDIANIQSAAKPAEFKFQPSTLGWHRFDCRLALDLGIPVNNEKSKLPLLKQLHAGLSPFCTALNEAIVIIDGRLRKPTEPLEEGKEGRRGKQKDRGITQMNHTADVFMDLFSHNNNNSEGVLEKCSVMLQVRGTLQSRAYVHSRATAAEAVQAIKQDIVRSLMARCEIHCEDILLIEEEQQDPSVVHEPPRRVFAQLPNTSITFSDYIFPGEKPCDSLEAYRELLMLTLAEEDIEFDCERLADATDLVKTPSEKSSSCSDVVSLADNSKSSFNILVVFLSLAIAALAISVAYLLIRK